MRLAEASRGLPGLQARRDRKAIRAILEELARRDRKAIKVPGGGTLGLEWAGDSFEAYRVIRPGTITAASIRANMVDGSRAFNLEVLVGGAVVQTVPLAVGVQDNSVIFGVPTAYVAGAKIGTRIVRTAGAGASTGDEWTVTVEVTE